MRWRFLLGLVTAVACGSGLLAAEDKITLKVCSLRVAKESPDQKGDESLSIYDPHPETVVSFVVSNLGDRGVLDVLADKSELSSLSDDKKTDLMGKAPRHGKPQISGWKGRVELRGYQTPVPGATKVFLKGKVALLVGSDVKTTEAVEIDLTKAGEIKVGNCKVSPSRFDKGVKIDVADKKDCKSVVFEDAEGKEIQSKWSSGYVGPRGASNTYTFDKPVGKVKVKITYYNKVETVVVPVEVEVGLGW